MIIVKVLNCDCRRDAMSLILHNFFGQMQLQWLHLLFVEQNLKPTYGLMNEFYNSCHMKHAI
jgi:hypothetical protein